MTCQPKKEQGNQRRQEGFSSLSGSFNFAELLDRRLRFCQSAQPSAQISTSTANHLKARMLNSFTSFVIALSFSSILVSALPAELVDGNALDKQLKPRAFLPPSPDVNVLTWVALSRGDRELKKGKRSYQGAAGREMMRRHFGGASLTSV